MSIPEFPKTEFDIELEPYIVFCEAFRRREDTLTLIYQLNQMVKAVQRHRGISMGLLAGNQEFLEDFNRLQSLLERRLATLEALAHCTGGLLTPKDKENLHLAWQTICQNWQDDALSDNFELHSHFIEQLLGMVRSLAKTLEVPLAESIESVADELLVASDGTDANGYPRMFQKMELLNFVSKAMPEMIEHLAKVRGLATYGASAKLVDDSLSSKLRYVLQCTKQVSEKIRQQAERLHSVLSGEVASLKDIKSLELKLMFLINTVEKDVLFASKVTTNSHQLFDLATELIDVYWKVVNDGLSLLRFWHQEDLDLWVKLKNVER